MIKLNDKGVVMAEDLRPKNLKEYIGQSEMKELISIYIEATKKRNDVLNHTLFYGPPGLGKTSIAHVIGAELEANVIVVTATSIEKSGDLAVILNGLEEGDILFIDEIHRLANHIEESIYSAMEDYKLNITIGEGDSAQVIEVELEKFTLIGATTRVGMLTGPMRARFLNTYRFVYYTNDELIHILQNGAKRLDLEIGADVALEIAKRSLMTPRNALKYLTNMRDFCTVAGLSSITREIVDRAFSMMRIDANGFSELELKYLKKLSGAKRPIGIKSLAMFLGEEVRTVEDIIEPFFIEHGYIEKEAQGRIVTEKGRGLLLTA